MKNQDILCIARPIQQPRVNAECIKTKTSDEIRSIYPLMPFCKQWKFQNTGGLDWPHEVQILFVSKLTGNQMGQNTAFPCNFSDRIKVGQVVDITIPLQAPKEPEEYTGFWKLADSTEKKFGSRARVRIHVKQLPKKSVILDDQQDVKSKTKHLQRFYPDLVENSFEKLLELFFMNTNYDKDTIKNTNLDMILNGTLRNESGRPYTMAEIFKKISETLTSGEQSYPWPENYPWPTE